MPTTHQYFNLRFSSQALARLSYLIVERVKAGLANARAKGKRLGRPVKDPGAAARVAAFRAEGMSLRVIAAAEGMSASGVRKMLLRTRPALGLVEE